MTIIDWVKQNATLKETAKMSDLDTLINDLDPLKNVSSLDDAKAFMLRNDLFKRALDQETTARVEEHDRKFKEKELPKLEKEISDRVNKELNPEETPEQKKIRELEERSAARDRIDAERELKKSLREKAKEIGADPMEAERFFVYGETAVDVMVKDHKKNEEYLEAELDKRSKERFKGNPNPPRGDREPEGKTMKRAEFDALDPGAKRNFIKDGGVPIE